VEARRITTKNDVFCACLLALGEGISHGFSQVGSLLEEGREEESQPLANPDQRSQTDRQIESPNH